MIPDLADKFTGKKEKEECSTEELEHILAVSYTHLTPRLANRLLKRVRDFAQVKYDGKITQEVASFALDLLEVDKYGLDQTDR